MNGLNRFVHILVKVENEVANTIDVLFVGL